LNLTIRPLEDATEWLMAYQVNVGQPVGDSYVRQQGTAGIASSDGRPCAYKIFGRTYTNALILVRLKDMWDCIDYGDGGAAVMTCLNRERAEGRRLSFSVDDNRDSAQCGSRDCLRNFDRAVKYVSAAIDRHGEHVDSNPYITHSNDADRAYHNHHAHPHISNAI
jgi:hypothetical protein